MNETVNHCNCGAPIGEHYCAWCHVKFMECNEICADAEDQDILVLCDVCSDSIRTRFISESESGYVVDHPFT